MATLTTSYQRIAQTYLGSTGSLNIYIRIYAKYNSQSTANNTSSVTYQSRLYAEGSGSYFYAGSTTTKSISGTGIGNEALDATGTYYAGETTLQTKTGTVTHNNDGNKSVSMSASFYSSPWGFDGTASGSANLPQIKRGATITNAPNFNDEENPTIIYNNPNGNNVSTLQICIASTSGTTIYAPYRDISKTGTSYTFELTTEERNALRNATPNSNTLNVRFYIKTVLGSSTIYNYSQKTLSIVNANPTFSNFDFADINSTTLALTGNSKYNINGYSTIRATISTTDKATANKGASMVRYRFIIGNTTQTVNYDDSNAVTMDIANASTGTYQIYAEDSRGNTTLVTKLATQVINYQPLYIDAQNSNVERSDGGTGEQVTLTYSGNIWNDSFGSVSNSITLAKYEYKEVDSNTWITPSSPTTITPTLTDNVYNFSNTIRSNEANYKWLVQKSYNVKITLQDRLSSVELELTPLPSGTPNISLNKNGVGIMCDYDENLGGDLQVGGYQIIENGTGYVKFMNGTLLCYGNEQITTAISNTFGSVYSSGNKNPNISFAQTFTNIYSCVVAIGKNTATAWLGDLIYSKTGITNVQLFRGTTQGSNTYYINYIAIGTWK